MTKYQFLLSRSSTPNGWRFMSTIWSIRRKANGKQACRSERHSGTFMTTAEISDKLVVYGSIKKPMRMSRNIFPRDSHEKRGFFVIMPDVKRDSERMQHLISA